MNFAPSTPINIDATKDYLQILFQHVDWSEGGIISLLGIGEKGTGKEGVFRERKFVDPRSAFMLSQVHGHIERWAKHGIASFIVPAVIHPDAEAAGDVKLDKVAGLTAILVDVDSGDAQAKLAYAEQHLGKATMLVLSGGITETGQEKIHAYWMLSEVETAVEDVAALRKLLAAKIGGDQSFGRATQVIRIPGSVYAKAGQSKPVIVGSRAPDLCYHLSDLTEAIHDMPYMPGCEPVLAPMPLLATHVPGSMMDFSGGAGRELSTVSAALTEIIVEGGDGDRNRWGQFSIVAGHEISNLRKGLVDVELAFANVCAWTFAKMDPPWPIERIRQEFTTLLNKDVQARGAMVAPIRAGAGIAIGSAERVETTDDLMSWAVQHRSSPAPKERVQLVEGLIYLAKRHLFVAEGGAGKTFLMMELVLKLAASSPDGPQLHWLGQPVTPEAHGKTYIILTGEDDVDELDIRWHALDPTGDLRRRAGDRLIALPMDNLGGAFPLVAYHPQTREAIASDKWTKLYGAIKGIESAGGSIGLIAIDTVNSTLHGEENAASVIGEYIRALAPICGDLKAALFASHHIRKPGSEPIRDADDMRNAIRGSTALPNAMRVVIGFWHAHDYQKQMRLMGIQPARNKLYCAAVLKTNMPSMEGVKYMLRDHNGVLVDVSSRVSSIRCNQYELRAWLAFCINAFADCGVFFGRTSQANGLFKQKDKLHPLLAGLPRDELHALSLEMVEGGVLELITVKGAGTGAQWLDLKANHGSDRASIPAGEKPPMLVWADLGFYDDISKTIRPYNQATKYG